MHGDEAAEVERLRAELADLRRRIGPYEPGHFHSPIPDLDEVRRECRAGDQAACAGRHQCRHAVGCRRGIAQVAAQAGTALHLGGSDQAGRLDQARPGACQCRMFAEHRARGGRADDESPAIGANADHFGNAFEVDDQSGLQAARAHLRHQVGSARQCPGAAAGTGHGGDRFGQRGGCDEIQFGQAILPSGSQTGAAGDTGASRSASVAPAPGRGNPVGTPGVAGRIVFSKIADAAAILSRPMRPVAAARPGATRQ